MQPGTTSGSLDQWRSRINLPLSSLAVLPVVKIKSIDTLSLERLYDEIFFFTDKNTLNLPDEELIAELKQDNPEWFD